MVWMHVFVGDDFITVVGGASGIRRLRVRMNGTGDLRQLVNNEALLKRTDQFRVMAMLGFKKIDKLGMVYERYDKDVDVRIRFYQSRVTEISVLGISVPYHSQEVGDVAE